MADKTDKPKILQVGVGSFGQNHLRTLVEILGHDNIFLAELDQHKDYAISLMTKFGIPSDNFTTDYRAFLSRKDISGVDIVTSTDSHYPIARDALEANKDVFIEKPMTSSSEQTAELIDIAEERGGLIIQPGHIFRYNPAVQWIKQHVDAGNLGKLRIFDGHFGGYKRPRTDVGVAWTDGVHFIDLAMYFFNSRPVKVQAQMKEFLKRDGDLEDWANVHFEFEGGEIAQVQTEYFYPGKYRDIIVVGERATVKADVVSQNIKLYKQRHLFQGGLWKASEASLVEPDITTREPLDLELRAFCKSVISREPPIATAEAAYNLARVIEAMYIANKERREVNIEYLR